MTGLASILSPVKPHPSIQKKNEKTKN